MSNPTPADLIKQYNQLKDWVTHESKRFDAHIKPHKDRMEQIDNQLLQMLNEQKCDSFSTPEGTAYKSTLMNLKVANREAFLDFCNEHWDKFGSEALLLNAQKDSVKRFMEENEGKLPPGVEVSHFTRVNIRRS